MGFMNAYKRLDNLLKTFPDYPRGISSYIDMMEHCILARHQCPGWSFDYARLKEYRHIRNRIAHDNGADEDDLCTPEDEHWLQNFHARVLNSDDPVALYYKSQRSAAARAEQATTQTLPPQPELRQRPELRQQPAPARPSKPPIGCAACLVWIALITLVVGWFVHHM